MKYLITFIILVFFSCSHLSATEFTISSYNCGGLSDHYDYLRAVNMQKLMQERYLAEPENMVLNDKIQALALKILFASDPQAKILAQMEWDQKGYQEIFESLTAAPKSLHSPNTIWHEKAKAMISSYHMRPVSMYDEEVVQQLNAHVKDLTGREGDIEELIGEARDVMARRTFAYRMKYDIICLQEADYLNETLFPDYYQTLFGNTAHSKNGIAWNTKRFEQIETIGNIMNKAFAVLLIDKETNKTVLVASGHLTGCNPYRIDKGDSTKGDAELQAIIDLFNKSKADILLIGMDSNVTSLHPRMNILKNAGYQLDTENSLESTCTNPYQVLNTRIDWITLKTNHEIVASVVNIPVLSVGLNSMETNMSDHKPIAAKISY